MAWQMTAQSFEQRGLPTFKLASWHPAMATIDGLRAGAAKLVVVNSSIESIETATATRPNE